MAKNKVSLKAIDDFLNPNFPTGIKQGAKITLEPISSHPSNNSSSAEINKLQDIPPSKEINIKTERDVGDLGLDQQEINEYLLMKTYGIKRLSFNLSDKNLELFNRLAFELKNKYGLKDYHVVNLIFEKFFESFGQNKGKL